jgi:hypothetical protein
MTTPQRVEEIRRRWKSPKLLPDWQWQDIYDLLAAYDDAQEQLEAAKERTIELERQIELWRAQASQGHMTYGQLKEKGP